MLEVLPAAAVGTYDQWFSWPGYPPNKVANVARPNDDTASGIGSYVAPDGRQSFTPGPSSIPAGDVIDDVAVLMTITHDPVNPASSVRYFLRLGGVEVYGASIPTPDGPTWYEIEETIARPGGGNWSAADIAAVEFGIWSESGHWSWATTAELRVTYHTPAPAAASDMLLCMP